MSKEVYLQHMANIGVAPSQWVPEEDLQLEQ
jgi:hypothetical protein